LLFFWIFRGVFIVLASMDIHNVLRFTIIS